MSGDDEYNPLGVRQPVRERVGKTLRPGVDDEGDAGGPQTVAAGQLRSFIERIERLEEEKADIANDIKEVFAEAKGTDTKTIRTLIRLRKKDAAERAEEEAILDLYMAALGMV